jgi:hypothetical protein
MKTRIPVVGLLLFSSIAMAEMRTWTFEQSGNTVRAEVVGFKGDTVSLRRDDGQTVSVRISYLTESDRTYLTSERARQWNEVEIVSLDGVLSAGAYKKCTVRGSDLKGEILITHLPAAVETILNSRNQQTTQISNLTAQVEADKSALDAAKGTSPQRATGNRIIRQVNAAQRAPVTKASGELRLSQSRLAEARKSYQESMKKTKDQTTVRLRKTAGMYQRLPIWECADPRAPSE